MACQDCEYAGPRGFGIGLVVGILFAVAMMVLSIELVTKPAVYRQIADGELKIEVHTWPDGTRDIRAIHRD